MEQKEVQSRILKVANQALAANLVENDLSGIKRLDELIGFDSMALLQWIAAIEREFQVVFPPERLKLDILVDLQALTDFLCQNAIETKRESQP